MYYLLDDVAEALDVHPSTLRRRKGNGEAMEIVTVQPAGGGAKRAAVPVAAANAEFDRLRDTVAGLPATESGDALLHWACRQEVQALRQELDELTGAHSRMSEGVRSWLEGTRLQLLSLERFIDGPQS